VAECLIVRAFLDLKKLEEEEEKKEPLSGTARIRTASGSSSSSSRLDLFFSYFTHMCVVAHFLF
jgi:hypothetical protein